IRPLSFWPRFAGGKALPEAFRRARSGRKPDRPPCRRAAAIERIGGRRALLVTPLARPNLYHSPSGPYQSATAPVTLGCRPIQGGRGAGGSVGVQLRELAAWHGWRS